MSQSEPVSFQHSYTEAGPDYVAQSPSLNLHFGFCRRGMDSFHLEPMLEQRKHEVLARLRLSPTPPAHILDMGCGVRATLRSIARLLPQAQLEGETLVPRQIDRGHRPQSAKPRRRPHSPHPRHPGLTCIDTGR